MTRTRNDLIMLPLAMCGAAPSLWKGEGRGYQNPYAEAARTVAPSTENNFFDFCEKSGEVAGWI